jgi:hypothetical protein
MSCVRRQSSSHLRTGPIDLEFNYMSVDKTLLLQHTIESFFIHSFFDCEPLIVK